MQICFCFSHWVFNVYYNFKCFLLLLIVKCYLFCSLLLLLLLLSRVHNFRSKQTFENKQTMMITTRLTPRVYVVLASYTQLQLQLCSLIEFVTHICQFIFVHCWSYYIYHSPKCWFQTISHLISTSF